VSASSTPLFLPPIPSILVVVELEDAAFDILTYFIGEPPFICTAGSSPNPDNPVPLSRNYRSTDESDFPIQEHPYPYPVHPSNVSPTAAKQQH